MEVKALGAAYHLHMVQDMAMEVEVQGASGKTDRTIVKFLTEQVMEEGGAIFPGYLNNPAVGAVYHHRAAVSCANMCSLCNTNVVARGE